MIATIVLLVLATGISPALGMTVIPANRDVNLRVSNDAGALFEVYGDDTYNFFNTNQSATQGQNALHISDNNASYNYGQVTLTSDQSGTFFMTDTGGRGWSDDGILMLAVNGTVPENFRVHIRSSGYRWDPVPTGSYPAYSDITYYPGAVDEYFTKDDFLYGPQNWRPAPGADNFYPIFDMQDMTDAGNTFSIMFIDLRAGLLGSGTWGQWDYENTQPVTDYGAVRIDYSFENLPTYAAFDAYAFTVSSNQGTGIRWLNRLSSSGASGYSVIGLAPTAAFTSDVQTGDAPLTVVFTDLSTNTPASWTWDFGDGDATNATVQDPVHTYAAGGTYTVKLTVTNDAGTDDETKTDYISVTVPAPVAGFTASGTTGVVPFFVRFTDTSSNAPTSWAWDFGDGSTSTVQSPAHTYMAEGTYTVKLTAANDGGSDSEEKVGLITVAAGSGNGGLAGSAWPKFHNDVENTGLAGSVGPQTNTVKWTFQAGATVSHPSIGPDGTIYVMSSDSTGTDKYLYAINPDGTERWKYALADYILRTAPAVGSDGTIYFMTGANTDNHIYALNPDGTMKWAFATAEGNFNAGTSITVGSDGTLYVGTEWGIVYAINPDGTQKWSYDISSYSGVFVTPAIAPDGTLFVSTADQSANNFYALNPDGSVKWSFFSNDGQWRSSPAVGPDGTIYAGNNDKKLWAINPDGSTKWKYLTGNYVYSSPAIGPDGTIYFGSNDKKVYALNPDGSLKWSYTTGGTIYSSPIVGADGIVYVGSDDKIIYAFNPDGTLKWSYLTPAKVGAGGAIGSDGTLYIGSGTGDNKLYAFHDPDVPVADFTSDVQTGDAPLTVVFTDLSTNTPASWTWDFGDGDATNATVQDPVHTYVAAGIYTVKLTATNAGGSDDEEKINYITVTQGVIPLPGCTDLPTDPDNDGIYEDLNGNGRMDFADVVLYFNEMDWMEENEPVAAFDLNANGRIDFADIVDLFNEV